MVEAVRDHCLHRAPATGAAEEGIFHYADAVKVSCVPQSACTQVGEAREHVGEHDGKVRRNSIREGSRAFDCVLEYSVAFDGKGSVICCGGGSIEVEDEENQQ